MDFPFIFSYCRIQGIITIQVRSASCVDLHYYWNSCTHENGQRQEFKGINFSSVAFLDQDSGACKYTLHIHLFYSKEIFKLLLKPILGIIFGTNIDLKKTPLQKEMTAPRPAK